MALPTETQPRRLPASPMVVGSVVGALASTAALIFVIARQPPPGGGPGNGTGRVQPAPPHPGVALTVVGILFAIAWVAVLIARVRDQILRRIEVSESRVVARLSESLTEYGELRETEGFVYGLRQGERVSTTPSAVPADPEPPGHRPLTSDNARAAAADGGAGPGRGTGGLRALRPVPPID